MAYQSGDIIEDQHFNDPITTVNTVYGDLYSGDTGVNADKGYGVTTPGPNSVTSGQLVTALQWNNIFSRLTQVCQHQGTAIGDVVSSVNIGDIITAYDAAGSGLLNVANNAYNNRLNIAFSNATITSGGSLGSSQRTTSWSAAATIEWNFTLSFGSYDNARHYFNSGGQIRFAGSLTGYSAKDTNTNIDNMLTGLQTMIFDTQQMLAGNGEGEAVGVYDLTDTYQTLLYREPAGYPDDNVRIRGRWATDTAGTSGAAIGTSGIIQFSVQFNSSGSGGDPDGTLTMEVDERRSTGVFNKSSPTYNNITSLSTGG